MDIIITNDLYYSYHSFIFIKFIWSDLRLSKFFDKILEGEFWNKGKRSWNDPIRVWDKVQDRENKMAL